METIESGRLPSEKTVVLIPAYRPDETLLEVLSAVHAQGLSPLVVDDGSGPDYADVFRRAEEFSYVLYQPQNGGKGSALKTGFRWIGSHLPECRCVVTADADGQHAPRDILRVARAVELTGGILIGSRCLSGKIPLRSRIGNDLSRFTYALAGKHFLRDNQSGLRGFDASLCDWLIGVKGERYEYEMNVLLCAALRNLPLYELPIQTVYFAGNSSSHFRPLQDTFRIQSRILATSWRSILATAVAFLCVLLATVLPSFGMELVPALCAAEGVGILLSLGLSLFPAGHADKRALFVNRLPEGLLRAAARMGITLFLSRGVSWMPSAVAWAAATVLLLTLEYILRRSETPSGIRETDGMEEHIHEKP